MRKAFFDPVTAEPQLVQERRASPVPFAPLLGRIIRSQEAMQSVAHLISRRTAVMAQARAKVDHLGLGADIPLGRSSAGQNNVVTVLGSESGSTWSATAMSAASSGKLTDHGQSGLYWQRR